MHPTQGSKKGASLGVPPWHAWLWWHKWHTPKKEPCPKGVSELQTSRPDQRHCVGVRYPSGAHGLLGLAHGQASARNPCMLIFVIELINHLKMCVCLGALESITQAPMGCTIGCPPPHTYFGMICELGHQTLHAWAPCMHLTMCKLKSPSAPLGWL